MIPIATPCTIVNLTATGVNDFGETVTAETSTATLCHLNVTSATEANDPDQVATSTGTVYLAADEALSEHSRIVIGGVSWGVAGIPVERRRAPTGEVHHLEVPVRAAR